MNSFLRAIESIFFHILHSISLLTNSYYKSTIILGGSKLVTIKKLGEGGFGVVYLVKDVNFRRSGNRIYALKRCKLIDIDMEQAFNHEVSIHLVISNPNVLKIIDHQIQSPKSTQWKEGLILMPCYKNGTLLDLINFHAGSGTTIPFTQVILILSGLLNALAAFHEREIPWAVRDLKPANVLLDSDMQTPILTDLASVAPARFVITSRTEATALQDSTAQTVTPLIRPPEFFSVPHTSGFQFDERTDIWSLGCIVYHMCFGESAFDGTETSALRRMEVPPANSKARDLWEGSCGEQSGNQNEWKLVWDMIPWMLNTCISNRPWLTDVRDRLEWVKRESGLSQLGVKKECAALEMGQ